MKSKSKEKQPKFKLQDDGGPITYNLGGWTQHPVAIGAEGEEWGRTAPSSGMARMFVIMLLIHVAIIAGIIVYDFMGEEELPPQAVTQVAREVSSTFGLPQTAPEIVSAQAQAAANTEQFDNYEMRSGDSIKSIALKFSTSEENITKMNMIDQGLHIGPGTMLRVPKQAVLSAIPVDPTTLKLLAASDEVPSAVVQPAEVPTSLSSAATPPMSLVAPSEVPPATVALIAATDTSAIALAAEEEVIPLPSSSTPRAVSLLLEIAPVASSPALKKESEVAVTAELKPLAESSPPLPKESAGTIQNVGSDAPPKAVAVSARAVRTHTLKSGETLSRIAFKYGVSVAAIQKTNRIKDPNMIRDGMKLAIPLK